MGLVRDTTPVYVASGSPNPAFGANTTAGNLVTVEVTVNGNVTCTVSGMGVSGNWPSVNSGSVSSGNPRIYIFYAIVVSGATTLTITPSSGASVASMQEFSGYTATLDTSAVSAGTGTGGSLTVPTSGSMTTTNATDLIVAVLGLLLNKTITNPSSPWTALTKLESTNSLAPIYQVVSTTGNFNPTWTWASGNAPNGGTMIALKAKLGLFRQAPLSGLSSGGGRPGDALGARSFRRAKHLWVPEEAVLQ